MLNILAWNQQLSKNLVTDYYVINNNLFCAILYFKMYWFFNNIPKIYTYDS